MEFYRQLATSVFSFATMGTKAIYNIDTYVYSSMQGTLESMRAILLAGRINDAYALLRKYHDSAVINVYSNLYLHNNFSIEKFIVENRKRGRANKIRTTYLPYHAASLDQLFPYPAWIPAAIEDSEYYDLIASDPIINSKRKTSGE